MANMNQAPQKSRAILKQIFGEKINEEYNLSGSLVSIGRHPKCQVQLSCNNVSRKHCILTYSNDGWRVMDNKSRNGTYINGRKLDPEEKFLLQYGDIVFLGPPSEMPQAFSYEELHDDEHMVTDDDDDDIIELPIKRARGQTIDISPQKTVKKFICSDIEIISEKHKDCKSSSSVFECHSKDFTKDNVETALDIPEILKITSINKDFNSESLATNSQGCSGELSEVSTAGSDHGGNSESLLNDGITNLLDPVPAYCPEEHWEFDSTETSSKRKSRNSGKSKDMEAKLTLLSEQIKLLQQSKVELLKNYEDACEKNKVLDQQLADKQKKLEEDLQKHEIKAKNEIKSELLEKLEEDLVCNICTELFIKPSVLDCSHTFCEYCIKEWRKKKNDCPICRCKIKNITRVRTLEGFIDKTLATLTPEQRVKRDSVLAQRMMEEQPPPKPAYNSPRRRRSGGRSRRHRHIRANAGNADSSVQILEESITPRRSHSTRLNPLNLPGDELNLQVNLPVFDLPVLRFFFS